MDWWKPHASTISPIRKIASLQHWHMWRMQRLSQAMTISWLPAIKAARRAYLRRASSHRRMMKHCRMGAIAHDGCDKVIDVSSSARGGVFYR